MFQLKGVYAAMPTIFHEDECLFYEENQRLAVHLAQNGLHGVITGGSTGEYLHMTLAERRQLLREICEAVQGRCQVIAQIGAGTCGETIAFGEYAAACGADACLVITPSYFSYNFEAIYSYYKMLSNALPLPIVIYHYPAATGVSLTPEEITALSELPRVAGLKNTEDMDHTAKCISALRQRGHGPERFGVASGYDSLLTAVFAAGGDASMGVIHNLFPKQVRSLFHAVSTNDFFKAQQIYQTLMPFIAWMDRGYYPGTVKAALTALGFQAGSPRRPIPPVSRALREELARLLDFQGVCE